MLNNGSEGKNEEKQKSKSIPIWQITQEGTGKPVKWTNYSTNPRFAVYDAGTPNDKTDDLVPDKETGLTWERSPGSKKMD